MEFVDLKAAREFSPHHHIHKSLTTTPRSDISDRLLGARPDLAHPQSSRAPTRSITSIEGNGLFSDGRVERQLGPGDTVIFPAGEVHQVTALTRMVLYRVQAGSGPPPRVAATPGRRG